MTRGDEGLLNKSSSSSSSSRDLLLEEGKTSSFFDELLDGRIRCLKDLFRSPWISKPVKS